MKRPVTILLVVVYWLWAGATSCTRNTSGHMVSLVDSLNQIAYDMRYKDLEATKKAAETAYLNASSYKSGRAEACNNLGFVAFMQMNFERAEQWFREVYGLTKNELELLIADIGLMKIYQRTSLNKEFYDYRNSALRRMKRIDEERTLFVEVREQKRVNFAHSEFFIVSAIYYYYLQQRAEALESIGELSVDRTLEADTNQLLYYHYIKGAAALCESDMADLRRLREFDQLYQTWLLASENGYLYFEGNGMQGLANLMSSPDDYKFFLNRRSFALTQFGFPVDSLLPMRLAQKALQKFREYNDLYQIAGAYVSIGKYLNDHGRYREALDSLTLALDCVNEHHRIYYDCQDTLDRLKPYLISDTAGVEKAWMAQELKTVPEWISRIREQLSVSYAGMEMKAESDYNRNIYLDILEETRQDKELESRYNALEAENRQLNTVFALVVVGVVGLLIFFGIFNRRSKKRNLQEMQRLQALLDVCQKITASIPPEARTEKDIVESILQSVGGDLRKLFGYEGICIEQGKLRFPHKPMKEEVAMAHVIDPYIQWSIDNGLTSISLSDERQRLEKQQYIHNQHIAANKRQNIIKKTCMGIVDGIRPYIDRIINEVQKLTQRGYMNDASLKAGKYQYIDELVSTINEQNDILALWIKMKQGSLSLNIETFSLNELFELLRKGTRAFEMKQQQLEVEATDTWVKADKALTLFMINTLAENARKYTQRGGTVKVYARQEKGVVEISVEDNGRGLSEEDLCRIFGEKVYDSRTIGMNHGSDLEELRENKGSGFGLMNCKGIIEKYRKTNSLFRVCCFRAESEVGKGSRFYFRLPAGVRKALATLCCFLSFSALFSCQERAVSETSARYKSDTLQVHNPTLQERIESEALLDIASDFANDAYFSNVEGAYEQTLQYVDSAITYLNAHYQKYASAPRRLMTLVDEQEPAELEWWNSLFNSDFHVILDIRNEAAVALLALKRWEAYRYNNAAYTSLYKLLGEDQSLEEYCRRLERSSNNKQVGILLLVGLVVVILSGYYILYYRKRLVSRWNLEQIFDINQTISLAAQPATSETCSDSISREEDSLRQVPRRIVDAAFEAVNELLNIERLTLAVYNESLHALEYVSNTGEGTEIVTDVVRNVEQCFHTGIYMEKDNLQIIPLLVESGIEKQCVGVLCLERKAETMRERDHLLLELTARYVAIVVFNTVVKLATKYRDIEMAYDDARRASWEDSQLHVQNQVLDNCLSTIKHETIYYPNRIKQLVSKLRAGNLSLSEENENLSAIGELIEYYKGIFALLSRCASRQLEDITFRRSRIDVAELIAATEKYLQKISRSVTFHLTLEPEYEDIRVVGDVQLLRFLLENLIDEACSVAADGRLSLRVMKDGAFVRFLFTDHRRKKSADELNRLFYPDKERMLIGEQGGLCGTEYLVCKQIIREHDEFAGHRGCRINAEPATEGAGFTVYFTLPIVE